MTDRRKFLRRLTTLTGAAAVSPFLSSARGEQLLQSLREAADRPVQEVIHDESFWHTVKQAYTVSPTILNLNNGGVSPQPRVVQEAVERYNRLSNETPSYYMWRVLDQGREPLREKLAALAGCSPEELAINRNSSEALETVIFGLPLRAGDEVVMTRQDYPNMINAWKQRAHRDGVVLRELDFDFPIEDEDLIVNRFKAAFTGRTRLVHITHMINWNGQVLPVQRIARAARERGIEVLVDAAHTFAHLDYRIPDLECDYWGSSLHKWLCAPFGTGLLYVRSDKIGKLYPLLAAPDPEAEDIRKFEHLGTRSFATEQAIGQAVDFHHLIGSDRKQQRLQYLKKYWAENVLQHDRVSLGTPLGPRYSGAIALLKIDGMDPVEVSDHLFRKHKIHTVPINYHNIEGVRITPNVYTLRRDLDRLTDAIHQLLRDG